MRLGVFGGSFDPPHIGHLILAGEAQYKLDLDRVLWVLTPYPPHKPNQPITPLTQRERMVKAAIEGNPVFKLSRVEIDRHPPHYAVDTVALLRAQYPEAELIYLMGGDSLRDLPAWHRPVEFVHACQALGVMNRPGVRVNIEYLEEQIPGIVKKILLFEAPLLEISASQIRQRVANGKPIRYFVPEAVHALICEYSLYRA